MAPYARILSGVFESPPTAFTPVPQHVPYEVVLKEAKQRLDASMDVVFRMLQNNGVSSATVHELRRTADSGKHVQALQEAQHYMLCFPQKESGICYLLIHGWECLDRLHTFQYQRAWKELRRIKLHGGDGNVRLATAKFQQVAEACAASQLGLYKSRAWKNRMELVGAPTAATTRSRSI